MSFEVFRKVIGPPPQEHRIRAGTSAVTERKFYIFDPATLEVEKLKVCLE